MADPPHAGGLSGIDQRGQSSIVYLGRATKDGELLSSRFPVLENKALYHVT